MAFLQDIGLPTLGARDFSSAVFGFCQVFVVTRAKSVFLAASAYGRRCVGQHRKFPQHERKTSGTQGMDCRPRALNVPSFNCGLLLS